jgi:hypothetical protein
MDNLPRPDGVERKHIHQARGSVLSRWPFGLFGLGVLLAPAFFGIYGSNTKLAGAGSGVQLELEGPGRARNGEFFELLVNIQAQRDIRDVVVLIGADLLRDVTVNTLLPDPSEHGFRDGSYEFHFGRLPAGESIKVKLDAQINPGHTPSANADTVEVADGETPLAKVFYVMEVLP